MITLEHYYRWKSSSGIGANKENLWVAYTGEDQRTKLNETLKAKPIRKLWSREKSDTVTEPQMNT